MNYEEKYKEVFKRAEAIIRFYKNQNRDDETSIKDLELIFPELKESEGEKVRKALIDFFGKGAKYGGQTNGVYDKDILAWLEKQGETSPVLSNSSNIGKDEQKPVEENKGNIGGISANSEWSEEDSQYVDDAITLIGFGLSTHTTGEVQEWLLSLKGRVKPQWKPSDVQIECLSDAIEHYNSLGYPASKLKELLDDLKELKGEV